MKFYPDDAPDYESRDEMWREAMVSLLKHFDESEGTTYLYSEEARRGFADEVDPFIRPQVVDLLKKDHEPSASEKPSEPLLLTPPIQD